MNSMCGYNTIASGKILQFTFSHVTYENIRLGGILRHLHFCCCHRSDYLRPSTMGTVSIPMMAVTSSRDPLLGWIKTRNHLHGTGYLLNTIAAAVGSLDRRNVQLCHLVENEGIHVTNFSRKLHLRRKYT